MKQPLPAKLKLEDGTVFTGTSFGFPESGNGEVVFNTGMVGYPESLTDPSYRGQILTYTYPLIGSYGVPKKELESKEIQVRGVIVSQYEAIPSHWESAYSLGEWLNAQGIPAITGIDTRALTKKLREHGVMLGQILIGNDKPKRFSSLIDPNTINLSAEVSIDKPRWYGKGKKQILLVDCGVKMNIIRNFVARGIRVKRVPWDYDFTEELKDFDGLFISNGPGDPKMCKATITHVRKAMATNVPQFGICLGSQIQGLAAGAKTYKLKYGHRGQNQPCVLEGTAKAMLTSQNHGYAVRESSLPKGWKVLYRNANDNSVEGLEHASKPFFSVQFHPEAYPGPEDANVLFDRFIKQL